MNNENLLRKKPKQEKVSGLGVAVHGDDVNKALRIFKKESSKSRVVK